MRALILLLPAFLGISTLGCADGSFLLDAPLAQSQELSVSGPLGFNIDRCHRANTPKTAEGMGLGKEATITIGGFTGVASQTRRDITTAHQFRDVLLRDYAGFLRDVSETNEAALVESSIDGVDVAATASGSTTLAQTLAALDAILSLSGKATETLTFTFFGKRGAHEVLGACKAVDSAKFWGVMDAPAFTMTCRFVSKVDGLARDLVVASHGSAVNVWFNGWLIGASPGEKAVFASQNVTVFGAGGITGFDLRAQPQNTQIAAISFVQHPGRERDDKAIPGAWALPKGPEGWQDAVMATLAIGYLFPWPSGCDAQDIRSQGLGTAPASSASSP